MAQEAMTRWFDAIVKKIRAGELLVDKVPLMIYEFMDNEGNISAGIKDKYAYVQRATDFRLEQLQKENEKFDTHNSRWRLSTFLGQVNRGYFEGEEADNVRGLAKQMLLYDTILKTE